MTTSRPFVFGEFYLNTPIVGANFSRPLGTTGILLIGVAFLDSIFGVPPSLQEGVESGYYDYDYHTPYDYYQGGYHDYQAGYEGYQPAGYHYYPSGESSYSHLGTAGDRWSSTGETWTEPRPHLVLGKARTLAEDQLTIYEQLQSSLSAVGVDGRTCLLRFICEAQHRRMQRLNLLGQMLATLLTPKDGDFLESYAEAADAGRHGSCLEDYSTCPVSLFTILDYAMPSKSPKGKRRKDGDRSKATESQKDTRRTPGVESHSRVTID